MAPSSSKQGRSVRRGLSVRLDRFRRKFQHHSDDASTQSPRRPHTDPNTTYESASPHVRHIYANRENSTGSQCSNQAGDASEELSVNGDDDSHALSDQGSLHADRLEQNSTNQSTPGDNVSSMIVSSDLWSAAYREAVDSLGKDIDVAILMGDTAAQLFRELEDIDKEATQESIFLRGVAYLRSIQVPLERFKLALDLASPLGNVTLMASPAIGMVRSVTAVSLFYSYTASM